MPRRTERAMWADNETEVDLLGFDFLVDTLFVALTEPRLLPLTVGLLGDWGSGKSSLMRITRQELLKIRDDDESPSRYVCVEFSPWQYEDYDDVKVALMTTVLDAIGARAGRDQQEQVTRLRRFAQGLGRWGRRGGRVAVSTAQAAAPLALLAIDPSMAPQVLDVTKAGVNAAASEANKLLEDPKAKQAVSGNGTAEAITDAGRFRAEFAKVVSTLEAVDAVVVFIDDLDRCLPETVVDTFEAIRLFLNTPKTAYVLAANQAVVESAIDSRYPQLRRPDGAGIGADYLEKMLQLKVAIPPLSAPEADTYVNLLLAELRLDDEQFAKVLAETRRRREAGNLQVAFNVGMAGAVLGNVPPDLVRDLNWAASIAEVLGGGLRGNPRQLKRFLNNLLLKHRSALRRKITLDLPVLAKLMVLEEQHFSDFQRLFDWQLTAPGPISELAAAESIARGGSTTAEPDGDGDISRPDEGETADESSGARRSPASKRGRTAAQQPQVTEEVRAWVDKPHVRAWLRLEPPLGEVDLGPYFTYSRDKLAFGVAVTRLPPHLQELFTRAQAEVAGVRRLACDEIGKLPGDERVQLVEALVEVLTRRPGGPAFLAALELAERAPDTLSAICDALMRIPPEAIPRGQAGNAVRRLPADNPTVSALLDRWENSDAPGLKSVINTARQAQRRSGRH
ncbi:KAP family P-loop NTPase fold protein [Amycolatopsis keratiniphila]|uniref:KAP family P-loop NTPase fold protein n=1 Tax=Amycolatopsis keratiniphila TaxID=129921 RepID=UPI0013017252|nr:P-loop NTPase fold protein [Amycolatopsis keratiniphila]